MADREYVTQVWQRSWQDSLAAELAKTNVPVEEWRTAGRVTKDKPNKEDLGWWFEAGLEQVQAYAEWLPQSGWEVAVMPDGRPAIELELTVWFGGTPVKAFIDCVYSTDGDAWAVADYKSGSHIPPTAQLGLYAAMLEVAYGQRPQFGTFYMSRKGELSGAHDLDRFTPEYWNRVFAGLREGVQGRIFVPRVSRDCSWCDVAEFCTAAGGSQAAEYDDDSQWQIPAHFSFSQLQAWADCGVKYKLSRLAQVPTKPAVWFVAGTALHGAIEQLNRDSLTGA